MPLLDLQQHLKQELSENPFLEMTEADVEQEVSLEEAGGGGEGGRGRDRLGGDPPDGFDAGGRRMASAKNGSTASRLPSRPRTCGTTSWSSSTTCPSRSGRSGWARRSSGTSTTTGLLSCPLEEVVDGAELLARGRPGGGRGARPSPSRTPRSGEEELAEIEELFRTTTWTKPSGCSTSSSEWTPPGSGARSPGVHPDPAPKRQQEEALATPSSGSLRRPPQPPLERDRPRPRESRRGRCRTPRTRWRSWIRSRDSGTPRTEDPYILPDLIVEKIDGEYHVFLNDTKLPRLRLSRRTGRWRGTEASSRARTRSSSRPS
jgi:RNA polymerase sigma-54 factor